MSTVTFPAPPPPLPFPERRRWPRYACEPRTYCRLIIDGVVDFWARRVQNVSTDGVKLLVDIPVPLGQQISIVLYHPGRRYSCQRQVQSIYSQRQAACEFSMGLQFAQALTALEVSKLV